MADDSPAAARLEPDYSRVCDPCTTGNPCSQPFESYDGDVYWRERIIRPAEREVDQEATDDR